MESHNFSVPEGKEADFSIQKGDSRKEMLNIILESPEIEGNEESADIKPPETSGASSHEVTS